MKYLSIDLETTGLDPKRDQILQLSMVVEDTSKTVPVGSLPHLTVFMAYNEIVGNPYALSMNSWILDIISGKTENTTGYEIVGGTDYFLQPNNNPNSIPAFLYSHFGSNKVTVAGKNVAGFDLQFFPGYIKRLFSHRTIDPGSMYFDPLVDEGIPSLGECLKRAGIDKKVPHDAREDAMLVIEVIRGFSKRNSNA